jgi:ubiquinone/menaquinone biosynthesis C-methylase UbiE
MTDSTPQYVKINRSFWNAQSDAYDEEHASVLSDDRAMAWGLWRIPESELQVLGDVGGKDILELGCGAARWSIALAKLGARPTGVDLSTRQLEHASRLQAAAGVSFPLVEAGAHDLPFPDGSFDIVFCDWGAMTFADPYAAVPEAARVLRSGGLFAFTTGSPISAICEDIERDRFAFTIVQNYFGLHRLDWGSEIDFQLPYGEWIRLFRRNGLAIEDLIENRPGPDATSTYRTEEQTNWARYWPMENLWKLRKE